MNSANRLKIGKAGMRILPLLLSLVRRSDGKVRWPSIIFVIAIILGCSYLGCNDLITDAAILDTLEEVHPEWGPPPPSEE